MYDRTLQRAAARAARSAFLGAEARGLRGEAAEAFCKNAFKRLMRAAGVGRREAQGLLEAPTSFFADAARWLGHDMVAQAIVELAEGE